MENFIAFSYVAVKLRQVPALHFLVLFTPFYCKNDKCATAAPQLTFLKATLQLIFSICFGLLSVLELVPDPLPMANVFMSTIVSVSIMLLNL